MGPCLRLYTTKYKENKHQIVIWQMTIWWYLFVLHSFAQYMYNAVPPSDPDTVL